MMLFLDTEWADVLASELVSLALVGRDERFIFYAERDPLPDKPTDFVRAAVYPLLKRGDVAMPDPIFAARLQQFIADVAEATGEKPTIGYDYWADKAFFEYAYFGFEGSGPSSVPVGYFDLKELNPHYALGTESYFRDNPVAAERRHSALIDAKAALAGYRAAVKALAYGY